MVPDPGVSDDSGCLSEYSHLCDKMGRRRIAVKYAVYFRVLFFDVNCSEFNGGIIKTLCSE